MIEDPQDFCTCGHWRRDHQTGACSVESIVEGEPFYCPCNEFELEIEEPQVGEPPPEYWDRWHESVEPPLGEPPTNNDSLCSRNKWHMLCDGLGWPSGTTSAAAVLDAIEFGQRENKELKAELASLRETISTRDKELAEMTKDRDLWRGEHNEDCPNEAITEMLHGELAAAEATISTLQGELIYAKAGAMCPVCVGDPITGKVCICGGSNNAHDAYTNCLRDSLEIEEKLQVENQELRQFMKQNALDIKSILGDALYPNQTLENIYCHMRHAMKYVELQLKPVTPDQPAKEAIDGN